jgi:hypothetical protein
MFFGATPLLMKGSKGDDVKKLQEDLIALGFQLPKYGADGIFGDETEKAVKNFQYTWGLAVDGIVGPETRTALDKALNLLAEASWSPSLDPMEYSPPVTITPGITPAQMPSAIQLLPQKLAGIDIKWFIFGGAALIGIMLLAKPKRKRK